MSRGNNKQPIFRSDDDRHHFLRLLSETVSRFDWISYEYSLMGNHFHFLLKTVEANISESMKFLNGTFTQYFNWAHGRVGHLFQGRFKSILVQESTYFRRLCRYIAMNPVKANLCAHPSDYKWSSFSANMGFVPRPDFLASSSLLARWGDDIGSAREAYSHYVLQDIEDDPLKELRYKTILGDDAFLQEIQPHLPAKIAKAIADDNQIIIRPPLDSLIRLPEGLITARETHGYSMQEIAQHLGIHPASLSRRYQRLVKRLGSGPLI